MTIWYLYYSQENGAITRIASLPQSILPNEAMMVCENISPQAVLDTHYVHDGILMEKPSQPPKYDEVVGVIGAKRQELLYQSDWTQIPNNPLTAEQQQAWAVYRQELRDITMQPGYPFNVVWPTPPQG